VRVDHPLSLLDILLMQLLALLCRWEFIWNEVAGQGWKSWGLYKFIWETLSLDMHFNVIIVSPHLFSVVRSPNPLDCTIMSQLPPDAISFIYVHAYIYLNWT